MLQAQGKLPFLCHHEKDRELRIMSFDQKIIFNKKKKETQKI